MKSLVSLVFGALILLALASASAVADNRALTLQVKVLSLEYADKQNRTLPQKTLYFSLSSKEFFGDCVFDNSLLSKKFSQQALVMGAVAPVFTLGPISSEHFYSKPVCLSLDGNGLFGKARLTGKITLDVKRLPYRATIQGSENSRALLEIAVLR